MKIRIVFDASSSGSSGPSLDNNLQVGVNLNKDIVALLINFRHHRIAMIADMKKAFLQIAIHEEGRDTLCLYWWKEAEHFAAVAENGSMEDEESAIWHCTKHLSPRGYPSVLHETGGGRVYGNSCPIKK